METDATAIRSAAGGSYAIVLGGANTDIIGFSDHALIARDSNPGHVSVSSGGVGRNIAENLARIGVRTQLVSAFGNDDNASRLRAACVDVGVDVSHSVTIRDLPGCVYLAIADEGGNMSLGLNDMRALDRLVPGVLEPLVDAFAGASVIVLDTNVGAAALEWACEAGDGVPIVLDPVSVAKAVRARSCLGRLHTLKANEIEARILVNDALPSDASIEEVAGALLALGVRRVIITMGQAGVHLAEASGHEWIAAPAVEIESDTGAGDAFAAGIAWGAMNDVSMRETARFASAMAALTLMAEETVDPTMSWGAVTRMMEEIR